MSGDLTVMTFNIRRRIDLTPRPADRWSRRRQAARELVAAERPTVLGVQEALPDQAAWVKDSLGEDYRFVGRGRGRAGRGEGCPLFFDTTRLELLDATQRWLSDAPEISGSTGWGNPVPRIVVRARFGDRETGTEFAVINTHLDAFSRRARIRSATALRELVASGGVPAVVVGDLNADERSRTVAELHSGGVLRDAWTAAGSRQTPEWGTFANYRSPRIGAGRIDHIAVSPGITVTRAAILAQRIAGRWPSDHLPVRASLQLTEESG